MSRVIGLTRPLTRDDDSEADAAALRSVGAGVVRTHASGLEAVLAELQRGDALIVSRAARVGPSLSHVVSVLAELGERGVEFRSLAERALCSNASATSVEVVTALDGVRRELLGLRTREGMLAAAESGRRIGRPSVMTPQRREMAVELRSHGRSIAHIAKVLGVSASAVRRALLPHAAAVTAARSSAVLRQSADLAVGGGAVPEGSG